MDGTAWHGARVQPDLTCAEKGRMREREIRSRLTSTFYTFDSTFPFFFLLIFFLPFFL
jgi:hypothetical protein